MPNIITAIVENTKKEVAERKATVSESQIYSQLSVVPTNSLFYDAVSRPKVDTIALIAEVKHRSPSAGTFIDKVSSTERVVQYQESGADAISYVSDAAYFGGSLDELRAVKVTAKIPVLQKDFIVDMYQIVEAAINKVDALLLIARILDDRELKSFVTFAQINSIEPVVEVYNESDLERALKTDVRVIGVNARNLDTFEIDREAACKLLRSIPKHIISIAFSGV
jgi:indole-3-glycerol phosphate synthase